MSNVCVLKPPTTISKAVPRLEIFQASSALFAIKQIAARQWTMEQLLQRRPLLSHETRLEHGAVVLHLHHLLLLLLHLPASLSNMFSLRSTPSGQGLSLFGTTQRHA
jgi:hypothetical protein